MESAVSNQRHGGGGGTSKNENVDTMNKRSDNAQLNHDKGDKDRVVIVPHLSLFSAVAVNVGSVVGSGLFISPKGVLAGSGSVGLALIMWFVCGLISLLGALCYAELGAMMPVSGGSFAYLHFMFGDLISFLFLWGTVSLALPASTALIALLFSEYSLLPFYGNILCPPPKEAVCMLALVCILVSTLVNMYSSRLATIANNILSSCKIISLCIISIPGLVELCRGKIENLEDPFDGSIRSYDGIGGALYTGLFSYAGWYTIGMVGGEIKNPEKNIPRAVYLSVLLIILVTMSTNVAYFVVLTKEEVLQADAVAATFGNKALGSWSWVMPASVAVATLGSVNQTIFSCARLYQSGAAKNQLPTLISMISITKRTPLPAILIMSMTIMMYTSVPNLFTLINYHSCFTWLFCGIVVLGQVILRLKNPDMVRPYKINILIPVTFVVVCIFLLIFGTIAAPMDTLIGMAIVFTGVPVYFVFVRPKRQLKLIRVVSESCTHWMQKLLLVVEEEK